ncbi:tetratricopeptide repeat protein [Opitutus terrae]|uniref:tetratricopeptide repeat protein n=1 Tax=Opitutus terrae TaxID=107709 RepID=UPI0005D11FC8|nr:tetratricopeptide repeat protein [Opitutus terrae]
MAAEAKTVTGRRRLLVTLGVLGLLGLALAGWRLWAAHAAVAGGVPPVPELAQGADELQQRVRRADAGARGYLHPQRSLAELARLCHANGFFDEAILCYETLQRLQPDEARWPHLHAAILATNGQLDEAAPLYRRSAELAPDYLPARLRLGDVLLKANRLSEAEQAYRGVLQKLASEPYAMLGLARCAIARDDWESARQQLQGCIAANPEFVGGLSLMATVHEHFGEPDEANRIREHVNKREFVDLLDPWVEALLEDCYDHYRLSVAAAVAGFRGDHASAERWLLRAIELSPKPAAYYRQLGKFYTRTENMSAARRAFEHATALAPEDSDAWALLVNLLKSAGERPAAYSALDRGLRNRPDSRALHHALGQMLAEDGRYAPAIAEFQRAKQLQPTEVSAYVEIALVHFRLGEIEAGMDEMRAALAVQPDHPVALVMLGRDAIARGEEAQAREWIRRARLQSRVRPEDLNAMLAEFQQKFGRLP